MPALAAAGYLAIAPRHARRRGLRDVIDHVVCGHTRLVRGRRGARAAWDFRVIRREWALKALRGIVRLQALVRGRLVRRQLVVTLNRMKALLWVQERAMERRARCSADAQSQDALTDRNGRADPLRETEVRVNGEADDQVRMCTATGWCS